MPETMKNALKSMLTVLFFAGFSALVSLLGIGNESIIMMFLLSVLFTAVLTSSRLWALCAAVVSVMLFNYLYTEPKFTFQVYSTNDLMMLAFFMVTAVVSGTVTSKLQTEMEVAGRNEQTTRTLYQIATGFLSASGQESVIMRAEDLIREYTGLTVRVELSPDTENLPGGYAIRTPAGTLGRLILSGDRPEGQKELIIQAVSTQLGIALERERLVSERESIRLAMERERQRTTLLRSIAHDLRSPLTALSGAGNLLSDHYGDLTDAERRKLASDVSEEIIWLSDLVENILNMTRINESQLLLQKDDEVIDDVVGEAVKHTERLFRDRKFSVTLPEEVVTAKMDGKLIAQVIINLLENAARHTPADSKIALRVQAEPARLVISVSDTGNGVPKEIRDRLFERFVTQDDRIVDGRRGLGLGLAICKTVVEAHGGEIRYEDNLPHGSIFSFTLPMEVRT